MQRNKDFCQDGPDLPTATEITVEDPTPPSNVDELATLESELAELLRRVDEKERAIQNIKESFDNAPTNKRRKMNNGSMIGRATSLVSHQEGMEVVRSDNSKAEQEELHLEPNVTRQRSMHALVSAQDQDAINGWANHICDAVRWERLKKDRLITVVLVTATQLAAAKKNAASLDKKESLFSPCLKISGGSYLYKCIGGKQDDVGSSSHLQPEVTTEQAARFLLANIPTQVVDHGNLYCASGLSRLSIYCDRVEQLEKQFEPVAGPWTVEKLRDVLEQISLAINRQVTDESSNRRVRVIRVSDASSPSQT